MTKIVSTPIGDTETTDGNLIAASSTAQRSFFPPRYVTNELLKKMGWEFIKPDQIKSQWKKICEEKNHD